MHDQAAQLSMRPLQEGKKHLENGHDTDADADDDSEGIGSSEDADSEVGEGYLENLTGQARCP